MTAPPRFLVLEDTLKNIKLLADLLAIKAMRVIGFSAGEALQSWRSRRLTVFCGYSHAGNERYEVPPCARGRRYLFSSGGYDYSVDPA